MRERGGLDEPRVEGRDARQRAVQLVQMVLEPLALAGEVVVPQRQDVQRRAVAVRAVRQVVQPQRAHEVGAVGHRAAAALVQVQQEVRVHALEIAALQPEPQRLRVVATRAEELGGPLAQLGAVDALFGGFLAQEVAEQVVVAVQGVREPHEERVGARKLLHDGGRVGALRKQLGKRRVELLRHAGGHAEGAQAFVPRVPHLLLEEAREQRAAAAPRRAVGLRERRHADGPPLGGFEQGARLVGREVATERLEVAAYLVGREAQVGRVQQGRAAVGAEHGPLRGQLGARQQQHAERPRQALEHGGQRLADLPVLYEVHVVQHQDVAALERRHLGQQPNQVLHRRKREPRLLDHDAQAVVARLHRVQAQGQLLVEHRGNIVVAVEADPHAGALRLLQPQQRRHRLAAARRSAQVHEAPRAHGALDGVHHPQARRAHVRQRRRSELVAEDEIVCHRRPFRRRNPAFYREYTPKPHTV